jgi:hypothetical protein
VPDLQIFGANDQGRATLSHRPVSL